MDISEVIDYSAVSDYIKCPRFFYFRHVRNWTSDVDVILDLVFGSAVHAGLEFGYEVLKADPNATLDDIMSVAAKATEFEWNEEGGGTFNDADCFPKNLGRAIDLVHLNFKTYLEQDRQWEVVGTEVPFEIMLGENLPRYIGRKDAKLRKDGVTKILEHKTTKSLAGIWADSFQSNYQVEGYITEEKLLTDDQVIVDINGLCTQKSKIDCTRLPISRQNIAVNRFILEMSMIVEQILNDKKMLQVDIAAGDRCHTMHAFRRNCGLSCTAWMRKCPYMDVCLARMNPETWDAPPAGFKVEEWDPRDHAAKKEARLKDGLSGLI